ncbi:MAG: site-specific integrase [Clostridiales bacterium]|jgi:integrase|nr:site-specific integrase [Clostridiales bacterium]
MGNRTTGEFLNDWLEQAVRGNVRQSTYMAYRGYIVNHLQEQIGGDALADLRAERLQSVIATLTAKGLAGKTIRSIMLMLRGALKAAVDYEYIARNPCDKVRLPKLEEKEVIVFNVGGQRRLEKTIAESGDTRNYGVLICLYTGLRIGELCGLKWDSVNFGQRTIEIKNSLNRVITYDGGAKKTTLVESAPKTKKSRRTIPLPPFLCQALKTMKRAGKSEYVISMKSGKAVEPRMMQIVYGKLLKSAGIEYVNFHTLRHTFATRAIETGADVKTVGEILGHANTMITVNRYAHSLFEQKRRLMDKLNALYNQKSKSAPFRLRADYACP